MTDRNAARALIAGSLAGLLTMVLHPTGSHVVRNAAEGASNMLNTSVHTLALGGQALLLAGLLALVARLGARRDAAILGYVCYAMASVAVLIAAVASGFIAPAAVARLGGADDAARAAMMNAMHYTGTLNQAFAKVHVLFSSAAIGLWSWAMLRTEGFSRALAGFGLVAGVAFVGLMLFDALRLDIHGFGLVVLVQVAWMIWTAVQLRRA